jgi:hypothetical protein
MRQLQRPIFKAWKIINGANKVPAKRRWSARKSLRDKLPRLHRKIPPLRAQYLHSSGFADEIELTSD